MKENILPALKLTLLCIVIFVGVYTLLIWGIAQAAPNNGEGETVLLNNKVVGYTLEGQNFVAEKYFNSRPSACGYNATASSGSNKGPSNPDYLKEVQNKVDSFLKHNPEVRTEDVPSELVTASASGLDPDLSPQGAYVQVSRISKTRNIPQQKIRSILESEIKKPLFGLFGPEKVNILKLNIDLDKLSK